MEISMNEFYIKLQNGQGAPSFEDAPTADISVYPWGGEYRPISGAQAVYVEGDGFYIRMFSRESDPRTTYTNYNDPVCNDSCLEFFCKYYPSGSHFYLNIEMNSAGVYLSYRAEGAGKYCDLATLTDAMPTVTPSHDSGEWAVVLHVPSKCIADVYGLEKFEPKRGDSVRCNFYKCGSKCEKPHYGVWANIDAPSPNFHLPEFFREVYFK